MGIFSRKRNTFSREKLQPVADESQVFQQVNKINSLVSESLGVGVQGADILENISVSERVFHGGQARNIYRSLDIVQRIIDTPALDALRAGFKITTNFDDLQINDLIMERLSELKYKEKFKDYLIHSRLYSRGAVMFPVLTERTMNAGRSHLATEVSLNGVEKIESLNVIHEDYFYFHVQSFDALARNFAEVDHLTISGSTVNPTRFSHTVLSMDIYKHRGISVLDRIYVACTALNVAEWSIAQLLARYRSLIVKYPSKEIMDQKDQKKRDNLKKLIDDIKNKFTSKSVAAVPDNFEFEYLQTTLTGLKEATDFLYEYLASVTGQPQSKIKGSAKGELAASEKDERDYYETVQSEEQQGKLVPLLDFLVPMLLYEKDGAIARTLAASGIHPSKVTWEITFNPMQSVNPLQDAQTKLINSQRAQIDGAMGIRNPEEMREELYPELEGYSEGPVAMSADEEEELIDPDPFGIFGPDGITGSGGQVPSSF